MGYIIRSINYEMSTTDQWSRLVSGSVAELTIMHNTTTLWTTYKKLCTTNPITNYRQITNKTMGYTTKL